MRDSVSAGVPTAVTVTASAFAMPAVHATAQALILPSTTPIIQASPESLEFDTVFGAGNPASQTLALTTSPANLSVNSVATITTPAGGTWLSTSISGTTVTVSVNVGSLAAGTWTGAVTLSAPSASDFIVPVKLVIGAGPAISRVQDAESARASVMPGEWAAIYGSNLSVSSRQWSASDFTNGNALPVSLDGVSVKFGGLPAAILYVSPGQLDVQVPAGISGSVPVVVTRNGAASAAYTASILQNAPSLFYYAVNSVLYAAAIHADGSLIGDPAAVSSDTKASAGETIVLYVNGLGTSPSGTILAAPVPYTSPVTVSIGGRNAQVLFAGLVAAGQFQMNVVVPPGLAAGNYTITVSSGGQTSPANVILPVN